MEFTGIPGRRSGDGTVPYYSLNYCANPVWKSHFKEFRVEELEKVEHREILGSRLFFSKLLEYVSKIVPKSDSFISNNILTKTWNNLGNTNSLSSLQMPPGRSIFHFSCIVKLSKIQSEIIPIFSGILQRNHFSFSETTNFQIQATIVLLQNRAHFIVWDISDPSGNPHDKELQIEYQCITQSNVHLSQSMIANEAQREYNHFIQIIQELIIYCNSISVTHFTTFPPFPPPIFNNHLSKEQVTNYPMPSPNQLLSTAFTNDSNEPKRTFYQALPSGWEVGFDGQGRIYFISNLKI